jgi:hypothetical protein
VEEVRDHEEGGCSFGGGEGGREKRERERSFIDNQALTEGR